MIYLAFYKGTKRQNPKHSRLIDRLVCWWTKSLFSHVEFVEDLMQTPDGYVGRCWAASNRDGNVRASTIHLYGDRWTLLEVASADKAAVLDFFHRADASRYDWRGALSHVLPLLGQNPLRWYCSEIVAAALSHEQTHVTPEQLFVRIAGRGSLALL